MYVSIVRVLVAYQTRTAILASKLADNISLACSPPDKLCVDIMSAVAYQNSIDNVA
jgi:hypothetical protein